VIEPYFKLILILYQTISWNTEIFCLISISQLLSVQSCPMLNRRKNVKWKQEKRRHDIQPNDIQHSTTQHKVLICDTQHNDALTVCWTSLCRVSYYIYYYAECHYAECRRAGCGGARQTLVIHLKCVSNIKCVWFLDWYTQRRFGKLSQTKKNIKNF